jgi:hypothetical protein
MTCAGLLGLALAHGWDFDDQAMKRPPQDAKVEDEAIARALQALGGYLEDARDKQSARLPAPKGALNLYFVWSVERVGVLYGLKTIGGKDWYCWGVEHLLPTQREDGSWFGNGYLGSSPTIDTSFALLFLKRADLMPGLGEKLQQRLKISDPGPKKSPGEKSDPKTGTKSPGQKSDIREREPQLKDGIRKKEGDEKFGPQSKNGPLSSQVLYTHAVAQSYPRARGNPR